MSQGQSPSDQSSSGPGAPPVQPDAIPSRRDRFSRHPAVRGFEVAVAVVMLALIGASIWIVIGMTQRARRQEVRRVEVEMGGIPPEQRPRRVDEPTRHPAPEVLVSLFGGVEHGGYFEPPPGELTLATLIAAGGGLSPGAEGEITIARKVQGRVEVVERVLRDDQPRLAQVRVLPGDVVFAPK